MYNGTIVAMNINANRGYSADQIATTTTLGDLLAAVEEAVAQYGEEALVVTRDAENRYGANFGALDQFDGMFAAQGDDADEEF